MSSFRYRCVLCGAISKNFNRYTQCQECLRWFCTSCTDNELKVVKEHTKTLQEMEVDYIKDLKINGKAWTWNKLCCVDCYNEKLAKAGAVFKKKVSFEEDKGKEKDKID